MSSKKARSVRACSFDPDGRGFILRYRIVDAKTQAILDDADGRGYTSPRAAYAAWSYKVKAGLKE